MAASGAAADCGLERCYWRAHSGVIVTAEILSSLQQQQQRLKQQQQQKQLLLIRLLDTGEKRLVRLRDTWPCRLRPASALNSSARSPPTCQKCRQRVDQADRHATILCQECGNHYHTACGLIDQAMTDGYDSGFFRCRNCCFRLAVRPLGAVSDGRDGRLLRAVKRHLEYSPAQLTWPNDLENADNVYCYCGGPGNTAYGMLRCIACKQHFHLACVQDLPDWMRYGLLPWDRFYAFLCACCNKFEPQPGTEFVHRLPMRWPDLVHMSLLNLAATSESSGFHWARHVTPWLRSVWHRLYVSNLRMADLETQVVQALAGHTKRFQSVVMSAGDTLYRPLCPLRPPVVTPPQPGSHLARVNWAARITYAPPRGDLPAGLLRDPSTPGPDEADAIALATAAAANSASAGMKTAPSTARLGEMDDKVDYDEDDEGSDVSFDEDNDQLLDEDSADDLLDADFKPGAAADNPASFKSTSSVTESPISSVAGSGTGASAGRRRFAPSQRRSLQQQPQSSKQRRRRPLMNLPRRKPTAGDAPATSSRGVKRCRPAEDADSGEPTSPPEKREAPLRRSAKPNFLRDPAASSGILDSDSEEQSYHSADFNTSEDDINDADFVIRGSRPPGRSGDRRQRSGGSRLSSRQRRRQRRRLDSSDLDSAAGSYVADADAAADFDDSKAGVDSVEAADVIEPSDELKIDILEEESDYKLQQPPQQQQQQTKRRQTQPSKSRASRPQSSALRRLAAGGSGRSRGSASAARSASAAASPSVPSGPIRFVAPDAASVLAFIPPSDRHPFRLPWELPVHTDVRARRTLWLQVHAVLPPPDIPAKLSELESRLDVACRARHGSPRKLLIGQLMGTRDRRLPDGKTTAHDSLCRWW